MAPSILVINPNSTTAMTDALRPAIEALGPSRYEIKYFTAPAQSGAPASINSPADADLSTRALIPHLTPTFLSQHAAFLVACYSAHPLVPHLRRITGKPVLGILEASVLFALAETAASSPGDVDVDVDAGNHNGSASAHAQFGIVSTGAAWALPLTRAVKNYIHGSGNGNAVGRFAGVTTTGLDANALHTAAAEDVTRRMKGAVKRLLRGQSEDGSTIPAHATTAGGAAIIESVANVISAAAGVVRAVNAVSGGHAGGATGEARTGRVRAICLGCAGMVRLDSIVREACVEELGREDGERVVVVDGVVAGVVLLEGILRVRGL